MASDCYLTEKPFGLSAATVRLGSALPSALQRKSVSRPLCRAKLPAVYALSHGWFAHLHLDGAQSVKLMIGSLRVVVTGLPTVSRRQKRGSMLVALGAPIIAQKPLILWPSINRLPSQSPM